MSFASRPVTPEGRARVDTRPSDALLTASLARMLASPLEVVSRERNPFSGAAESEVVRLRIYGDEARVLVKYNSATRRHTGHGFWGDLAYEAAIYRGVLGPLGVRVPRLWGLESSGSSSWLVTEFVNGVRLAKAPREALIAAGGWLGEFHGAGEATVRGGRPRSINVLDTPYFRGWARRTRAFTRSSRPAGPWLDHACALFERAAPSLAGGTPTIVHGEFYPANILVEGGSIIPVDWQSAAVGPGEIDVASLIEGWGDGGVVAECLLAYERSRWPQGAPASFRRNLHLARAYWPLRWLGDDPTWSLSPKRAHYFERLKDAARLLETGDGEGAARC
jgi:aminoglycoside phosphotransferase (APT) family kinase protein